MGIREYLARRRERRARERAFAGTGVISPDPETTIITTVPPDYLPPPDFGGGDWGGAGEAISATGQTGGSGGFGGGGTTPTTTPTPTPTQIPSTTILRGVTIPPSIDIATQQKLRGEVEIYDPRTGAYKISPYGYGAGGTALQRYPTIEEQRKIELAQERGAISELPPLKLLAGEYEWQKKSDKKKEEPPKDIYGEQYTYKELYEAGALPTIVRKTATRAGLFFVWAGEKITGRPVSPELKKQAAQAIGTIFLFSGFAPAMRAGTYSEQVSKQLSKTRFDKLKELLNKAEKKIAEQKTLQDQAKILKQIKDNLKTPEQIKNYNLWVKSLEDKGIIHQVKVDVKQLGEYKPTTITAEIAIDVPTTIPIEKIGLVSIDPSKVRDVTWVGEKAKPTQVQEPLSMNIFQEVSVSKQVLVSTAAARALRAKQKLEQEQKLKLEVKEGQMFIQPTKQIQKQIQLQKQVQLQRQVQLEKQAQLQKQIQVLRLKEKIEPKLKIPFKLGEAMDRIKKIAKEKPEVFEVFGRRFGEEVKLGIFKTKPKAEKKLEKFLIKTLGAAGFVEREGKKLEAKELELLKKKGFRPSKISEFLVVEKKEKRLRRKTTGIDIQFFRKSGRRKGKSLFGI